MIVRVIFVALFTILLAQRVSAQPQQIIPIYNTKDLQNNTLKIGSDSGNLAVTVHKPNVIQVSFVSTSGALKNENTIALNLRVTQNLDDIFFATDSLWIIISKLDLSVRFLKKNSEQYLIKNKSYFLAPPQDAISFSLSADDLPSLFDGNKEIAEVNKLLRNGTKLKTPVLVSPKGYAVLIENPSKQKIKVTTTDHQIKFDSNATKFKNFFFFSGTADEIKRNLNWIMAFNIHKLSNSF